MKIYNKKQHHFSFTTKRKIALMTTYSSANFLKCVTIYTHMRT